MKFKIEFDTYGNLKRASTWLGSRVVVGHGKDWQEAEAALTRKLQVYQGTIEDISNVPEAKEVEL